MIRTTLRLLTPHPLRMYSRVLRLIWRCRSFEGSGLWAQSRRMLRQLLAYHGIGGRRIAFYPDRPRRIDYILRKLLVLSSCKMSSDPRDPRALAVFKWRDSHSPTNDEVIVQVSRERAVDNIGCEDISKEYVEQVFLRTFGYSSFVDPLRHAGPAVQKNNGNAHHDGKVVQCPLSESDLVPGMVYMRLVDNRSDDEMVEDLRTPILRGTIPLVYRKLRPVSERFSNSNSRTEVVTPESVFTPGEIANILDFCRAYTVDYCELDILRDRDDGRIYIVDVNNTPFGPPNRLSPDEELRALRRLEDEFNRLYLGQAPG